MTVTKNSTLLDPYGGSSSGITSTAFTTPATVTLAVSATSTDGLVLKTDQTASAGAQKWSPALHFQGSGWRTNATAQAMPVDFKMELVPVEGSSVPGYNFNFASSINNGAYATRLTIGDLGLIQIPAATGILMDSSNSQFRIDCPTKLFCLGNTFVLGFSTGSVASPDTGLSRISAGVVGVGTGAAGSFAGALQVGGGFAAGSPSLGCGTTGLRFSAANGNIYVDQAGVYMCSFLGSTFSMKAAGIVGFESAGAGSSCDTSLSRISAGVVGVGTGAAASVAGGLDMAHATIRSYYVHATPANSSQLTYGSASELLTLSTSGTTTDTSASLLPANAIIDAVTARVITTITTATSWQLGDPTTAGRFTAANSTMTAGTTDIGTLHYDNTGAAGRRQVAAAKVRVTTVGTPGAGAIRITVFYHTIVPPQS